MQYKIKSKNGPGYLKIEYLNGVLKAIKFYLKKPVGFARWKEVVPFLESELDELKDNPNLILQAVEPVKDKELGDKVALFCKCYNSRFPEAYKVNKALREHDLLKDIPVTEELLKVFLDSTDWRFKMKNIRTYASRINELQNYAVEKQRQFPDIFNKNIMAELNGKEREEYFAHLRSLGFQPVYNTYGHLVSWEKSEL